MTVRPSARLAGLSPVPHGGIGDAELARHGLARAEIVDFSVNANPLGPSPAAVAAASAAAWDRYPDDAAAELRDALAARDGVLPEEVVVGNGSAELIWLLALAFLDPGDAALIVGPTFGEYARAAGIAGAAVHELRADPVYGFAVDIAAVMQTAEQADARAIFLCNPNNPTGTLLPADALDALAEGLRGRLLAVDEAYRQFVDEPPATTGLLGRGNVVLFRSLTKDYALPGLRLGYALAAAPIRRALDAARPPWSVNAVAQAAGLAALADEDHLALARDEVRRARVSLTEALAELGLRVIPPAANFVLVEVGDGAAVRAALLRRGLVVRDCASFGLPAQIRIGLRPVAECARLVAALTELGLAPTAGNGGAS